MEIEIPGGSATLKDKLTVRERRQIEEVMFRGLQGAEQAPDGTVRVGSGTATAETVWSLEDTKFLVYLQSWTLDKPVPTTPEELLDLDADVLDAVVKAVDAMTSAVDTSPSKDKSSPTTGSPSSVSD